VFLPIAVKKKYMPVFLDDAISVAHSCRPVVVGQTVNSAAQSGPSDTQVLSDGCTTLYQLHSCTYRKKYKQPLLSPVTPV